MDLKVIKVMDVVLDEESEKVTRLYLPMILKKSDVEYVTPNITQKGKPYKTMSVLKTYSGDTHIVMGNYLEASEIIKDKYISKNIGYK